LVPQFLGIFWKRGTKEGAIAGMVVGFVLVIVLESFFARQLEAAWGLTSGVIALAVNLAIYAGFAWLRPHGAAERQRIDGLFGLTREAVAEPAPQPASVGASARA
jgi:solute:Na+ symporter, SSS family